MVRHLLDYLSEDEARAVLDRDRRLIAKLIHVQSQFQIFYKLGAEQPEYVPDFVAEAPLVLYQAETKARGDLDDPEVRAKADAAANWCRHASDYSVRNGGKPWCYLLIPHDEINEARTLGDFERFVVGDGP